MQQQKPVVFDYELLLLLLICNNQANNHCDALSFHHEVIHYYIMNAFKCQYSLLDLDKNSHL